MILFFDTETTGFNNPRMPAGHECQPHLVQLAMILMDLDGSERASVSLIVNPGVPIPEDASRVHGITDPVAEKWGVAPEMAVRLWGSFALRAHQLVAHNIDFDIQIMQTALHRIAKGDPVTDLGAFSHFCTMRAATPIINLPPTARMVAAGFNKPKPPKLAECVRHFFGEDLAGAHDALVDVRACARVFFHLHSLKANP